MEPQSNTYSPSLGGCLALLFWSFSALILTKLSRIPVFEIFAIAAGVGFCTTVVRLTVRKRWKEVAQPWYVWTLGIVCVCGNNISYMAAFKYAPPEQVDLINFLWPLLVVLFAGVIPRERFSKASLIGALIGFFGIYLLLAKDGGFVDIESNYLVGYALALGSAVTWTVYTLLSRHWQGEPANMAGLYVGAGCLVSAFAHFSIEETVIPNLSEFAILMFLGMACQGGAAPLWDYGVKKGNFKMLSVLSYGTPLFSVGLLVLFGESPLTKSLAISCLLVMLGSAFDMLVARTREKGFLVNISRSAS